MPIKRQRQTKILATVGPASASPKQLKALFEAGVDVFRLNFSHGTHKDHAKVVRSIRAMEKKYKRNIGIVADMQGPKLRLGAFKDGAVKIKAGQIFRFDLKSDQLGDESRVSLPHPEVMKVLKEGSLIYLDDGKVRARIKKKGRGYVDAKIIAGTSLSDKKGLNVPGAVIPLDALTDKDRKDLKAALNMGVDWIAQSFVQTADDVKMARRLIRGRAALMVKLEKPSALEHLDEIIAKADGVMLARGDLGIEIPAQKVPTVQKDVIDKVRRAGKPVVVATQMLESMIESPQPTRAEVSDVATAVFDGADAVMLSGETAVGGYAIEAVQMMDAIAHEVEEDNKYRQTMDRRRWRDACDSSDAIAAAAHNVADSIKAGAIVCYTVSGSTALRMARGRPTMPILCLTPHKEVAGRLTVSFGVTSTLTGEHVEDFTGHAKNASKKIKTLGLCRRGAQFVMTAGMPFGQPGSTNILRIAKVE